MDIRPIDEKYLSSFGAYTQTGSEPRKRGVVRDVEIDFDKREIRYSGGIDFGGSIKIIGKVDIVPMQ